MKGSKLKEFLGSHPSSRIGKRSKYERKIREVLVCLLKVERKLTKGWMKVPRFLNNIEEKLRNLVSDWEKESHYRLLNQWKGTFPWRDLDFLDYLPDSDLLKINNYNMHWMKQISHSATDERLNTSVRYPYDPEYTFLYEIVKDSPRIDEKIKSELREKATKEVWKLVCDEVAEDVFLYKWGRETLEHIFEYIPQIVVANYLRWTWNNKTETEVKLLWRHIALFTELDENYKKQIEREYNKQCGIANTSEDDLTDGWVYIRIPKSNTWDPVLDNYNDSRREDIEAFMWYLAKKDRFDKRFKGRWWFERVLWMLVDDESLIKITSKSAERALDESQHWKFPKEFAFKWRNFILLKKVFSPINFKWSTIYVEHLPLKENETLLDMWCGCGVIWITAFFKYGLSRVVCADISPYAVENTKENILKHNLSDRVEAVQSDVFSNIDSDKKFNLIFRNAPYFDGDFDESNILYWSMYDKNYEHIKRFILDWQKYLKEWGRIMIWFSSDKFPLEHARKLINEIWYDLEIFYQWKDSLCFKQEILEVVKK